MAIDLENIKPNVVTPNLSDKIWLFYGDSGTRKTSVSAKFPNHLIFAFDIGFKLINGACAVPMYTWADLKSGVRQLDKPSIKEKYKTIIIDTVGICYNACYKYVLNSLGIDDPSELGYGKAWRKIREEFESQIRSIASKGYNLVLLAHADSTEKEDKISNKKVMTIKMDMDKRPEAFCATFSDFAFYLNKELDENGQPTVYAYSDLIEVSTKKRGRYFAPRFEFTFENLQEELNKAIIRQYKEEGLELPQEFDNLNYYEIEKLNFNDLLTQTKELATTLVTQGFDNEVNQLLFNVFNGTKLSELSNNDINSEKLEVVLSELESIKDKAGL